MSITNASSRLLSQDIVLSQQILTSTSQSLATSYPSQTQTQCSTVNCLIYEATVPSSTKMISVVTTTPTGTNTSVTTTPTATNTNSTPTGISTVLTKVPNTRVTTAPTATIYTATPTATNTNSTPTGINTILTKTPNASVTTAPTTTVYTTTPTTTNTYSTPTGISTVLTKAPNTYVTTAPTATIYTTTEPTGTNSGVLSPNGTMLLQIETPSGTTMPLREFTISQVVDAYVHGNLTRETLRSYLKTVNAKICTDKSGYFRFILNGREYTIYCNDEASKCGYDGKQVRTYTEEELKNYGLNEDQICEAFDFVEAIYTEDGFNVISEKFALKPEFSSFNAILDYEKEKETYYNQLVRDNFLDDTNKKELRSYTDIYISNQGWHNYTDINHEFYKQYITVYTGNELKEQKQKVLDKFIKDFSEGNIAESDVKIILNSIDAENISVTTKSSKLYVKFTYNAQEYELNCTKSYATSGSDSKNRYVFTADEVKNFNLSEDIINQFFISVAVVNGKTSHYAFKSNQTFAKIYEYIEKNCVDENGNKTNYNGYLFALKTEMQKKNNISEEFWTNIINNIPKTRDSYTKIKEFITTLCTKRYTFSCNFRPYHLLYEEPCYSYVTNDKDKICIEYLWTYIDNKCKEYGLEYYQKDALVYKVINMIGNDEKISSNDLKKFKAKNENWVESFTNIFNNEISKYQKQANVKKDKSLTTNIDTMFAYLKTDQIKSLDQIKKLLSCKDDTVKEFAKTIINAVARIKNEYYHAFYIKSNEDVEQSILSAIFRNLNYRLTGNDILNDSLSKDILLQNKNILSEVLDQTVNIKKNSALLSLTLNKEIEHFYQGQTGDCWLLSGLNAIASTTKGREIIKNSIKVHANGDITVTFKGVNNRQYTITAQELVDKYKEDSLSWGDIDVLAVEMAMIKLAQDFHNSHGKDEVFRKKWMYMTSFGYSDTDSKNNKEICGGYPSDMIYVFTGCKADIIVRGTAVSTMKTILLNQDIKNTAMAFSTSSIFSGYTGKTSGDNYIIHDDISGDYVLYTNHAYTIADVTNDYLYLINPHDTTKTIRLSWEDVLNTMSRISYANIS